MEIPDANFASLDTACCLVGRFLFHFALLERELDKGIGKILGLDGGPLEIATANMDFARKVNVLRAAEAHAGSRPDAHRAKLLQSTFKSVYALNDQRKIVAHCAFAPASTGGVTFRRAVASTRLDVSDITWTEPDFQEAYRRLEDTRANVEQVVEQMQPYIASLDFSDPRNSGLLTLVF